MLIYNGQIIAGGGTIVLPMTRAEYEANKAILDSADVWVDLIDEPDAIATADQVAYSVGQTQKNVGYIGDIATKALAKVEPTDTALYLHEVGTYFINKDGNMCMTDSQIAVGGTIVLDANCHVVDGGISNHIPQAKNNVPLYFVLPYVSPNNEIQSGTVYIGEGVTAQVVSAKDLYTSLALDIKKFSLNPNGAGGVILYSADSSITSLKGHTIRVEVNIVL